MALRIGCLAWGSLLWDPRTLPRAGDFKHDGPPLPIEFSRVSLDGRVTLVIDPTAREVQTYWVPLAVDSLSEAVEALGRREKISRELHPRWVGLQTRSDRSLDAGETDAATRERVASWLGSQALDAVVWTALPSRGPQGESIRPKFEILLDHLESLEGEARSRAEEYIRRTPLGVRTSHRQRFEEILGWIPQSEK
jgi:hypothetical protein